jgi:hypothetical protein
MDLLFFIILVILVFLITMSRKTKANYNQEEFVSIFSSPGKWMGKQVGDMTNTIWNGIYRPVTFGRDVIYNITPNYTMIDRYLKRKTEWVRANKGMPPMIATRPSVRFKFDKKENEKKYSAGIGGNSFGKSVMNSVI